MRNRLLEWVEATPPVQKVTLVILLLGLLGVSFFFFIAQPTLQQIQVLTQDIADLDRQVNVHMRSQERLLRLQTEISRLESRVVLQEKRLGLEVELRQILGDILDAANAVGVTLTLWKPEGAVSMDALSRREVRIRLHAEGTYHSFARFLERVQYLPKTLALTGMTMTVSEVGAEKATLQATFDFMGYETTGPLQVARMKPGFLRSQAEQNRTRG